MNRTLGEALAKRPVIVCCGSGGVGKTTTSAVLAIEAAKQGRSAAVVTIDPARRLADALGLQGLTNTPQKIDGPWSGSLSAVMLDTKNTFDALIASYAADDDQRERILENSFYRTISGSLSGTQEYMAAEKLYELYEQHDFDVVVVDTPPTRNALDFLEAPERLWRFLSHPLYRVLTAPARGVVRAMNVAARTVLRSMTKVIGGQVIADAIAFFQAFDGMEDGFKTRSAAVRALLTDPSTAYVLVTSARSDSLEEATFFADRLAEDNIDVAAVVVNRVHPGFADEQGTTASSDELTALAAGDAEHAREIAATQPDLAAAFAERGEFRLVAAAEMSAIERLHADLGDAALSVVPLLADDVHDIDSLDAVRRILFGEPDAENPAVD